MHATESTADASCAIRTAVALAALFPASIAGATDGTYNVDAARNWEDTTAWVGATIPDGVSGTASIRFNITAARTVTLTASRSIGNLIFEDATTASDDWTLARGSSAILTLDDGASKPTIQVVNQTAIITAVLAGVNGFEKSGTGVLTLNAANTFTGSLVIQQGTVQVNTAASLGNVAADVVFDNTGANNAALLANVTGLTLTQNISLAAGNTGTGTISVGTVGGIAGTFAGSINVGARSIQLQANAGSTATYTGAITTSGGVVKINEGAIVISGDVTGMTGSYTYQNGQTRLDSAMSAITLLGIGQAGGTSNNFASMTINDAAGAAPVLNRINDVAPVTQQNAVGGRLRYDGFATASSTETFGAFTINSGVTILDVRPGTGQSAALTFASLTRNGTASALRLTSPAPFVASGRGATVQFIGRTNDASGIIGPWASANGDFASVDANGFVIPFAGYIDLPADAATAVPTANHQITGPLTLTSSGSINTLKFNGGATAQTVDVGANTLTVSANGLVKAGAGVTTVTGSTGSITLGEAGGSAYVHVDAGTLALDTPGRLVVTGSAPRLFKTGAGTLAINGLSAATIPNYLQQVIRAEGTLELNLTGDTTLPATLTGSMGLTVKGVGNLSFGVNNTFAGPVVVDGGGLNITSNFDARLGNNPNTVTLMNGGRLLISSAAPDPGANTKSVIIGVGGGRIDLNGVNMTLNDPGQLAGTGTLTKSGSGNLILDDAFTNYDSAETIVTAGVLQLRVADALGDATPGKSLIRLNGSGATLETRFNTNNVNFLNPVRLDTSGNIKIGRTSAGAAVTHNFGFVTVPADVTMSVILGQSFNANVAGSVTFTGALLNGNLTIAATNTNGTGIGRTTFSGPITQDATPRSLTKTGPAELSVTGAGTYAGGTTLSDGMTIFNSSTAGPVGALTAGPLGIGPITLAGTGTGAIRAAAGATLTLGNTISIAGDFTFGENVAASTGRAVLSGPVTLTGARTLTTAHTAAATVVLEITGPVSGTGASLTKAGAATMILSGANTYDGGTTVNAGRLLVNNATGSATGSGAVAVNNSGTTIGGTGSIAGALTLGAGTTLAPGASPGNLAVGSLTMDPTSTLAIELAGNTPGDGASNYDQVNAAGAANVDGTLTLSLLSGFTPAPGDVFYIVTRTGGTGAFANAAEGAMVDFGGNVMGQITYLANWTGDQATSTLTGGDDVAINITVPEPAGAAVVTLAACCGLLRRRRASKPR